MTSGFFFINNKDLYLLIALSISIHFNLETEVIDVNSHRLLDRFLEYINVF